ncbi:MAG: glycosyltransferase family 39 protein [bacterium]|nr:glycosyltransferase family 39 protein [bacterium]
MPFWLRTQCKLGLVVFLLITHLFVLTRIQFTVWPEMMFYPWLASQGYSHYTDIIHPYFPGLIWILQATGSVFGFLPTTIQSLTSLVILLIDVILFIFLRRLYGWSAAYLGLAWFILWQSFFEGNGLWFDLATVPFLLTALYFFQHWREKRRRRFLLCTSISLLFAILIKQSAALVVLPLLISTWLQDRRSVVWFLSPLALGLLGLFGWFSMQGNLLDILYWSIWFPLIDERAVSSFMLLPSFREVILFLPILILTFLGLLKEKKDRWFWGSVLFLTLLPVFPRWSFFHLQPFLAVSTILIARFFIQRPMVACIGFFIAVMITIPFYIQTWGHEPRFFGQDLERLASSVRREIGKKDVFILTGDQLLYPVLGIVPPKPWADWFPWYYEVRGGMIEQRLLEELRSNPPAFVLIDNPQSERAEYRYRPASVKQFIEREYQEVKEIEGRILLRR